MGSAVAIQVVSGKEEHVKKLMVWALSQNETIRQSVIDVHTFVQKKTSVSLSGELGLSLDSAIMPGYVFIELADHICLDVDSICISTDLWYMIKQIPFVIKQFTNQGQLISASEFSVMLGIDVSEQAEVVVDMDGADDVTDTVKESIVTRIRSVLDGFTSSYTFSELDIYKYVLVLPLSLYLQIRRVISGICSLAVT